MSRNLYPNPLQLPIALLGKGQALADLYLPVRINGDVAAIKGILKDLFERERAGRASATNQGQPLDLTRFLRIAIGLVAARGQVHRRGLIPRIRSILSSFALLL